MALTGVVTGRPGGDEVPFYHVDVDAAPTTIAQDEVGRQAQGAPPGTGPDASSGRVLRRAPE